MEYTEYLIGFGAGFFYLFFGMLFCLIFDAKTPELFSKLVGDSITFLFISLIAWPFTILVLWGLNRLGYLPIFKTRSCL